MATYLEDRAALLHAPIMQKSGTGHHRGRTYRASCLGRRRASRSLRDAPRGILYCMETRPDGVRITERCPEALRPSQGISGGSPRGPPTSIDHRRGERG